MQIVSFYSQPCKPLYAIKVKAISDLCRSHNFLEKCTEYFILVKRIGLSRKFAGLLKKAHT